MTDKTVAWLQSKIAEAAPPQSAFGDHVASLASVITKLRQPSGSTMLFGLFLQGETLTRCAELLPLAEQTLAAWKEHLVSTRGSEGAEAFRQITLRYGLAVDPPPELRKDPAVSAALARLFSALDDVPRATEHALKLERWVHTEGYRLAYHVVRNPDPIGLAQLADEIAVPAQLEGLYAELDELVIGCNKVGGQSDKRVYDFSEIEPISRAEVLDVEGQECVTLHQWDMGRLLLLRTSDGAVLDWISKFDEHPSVVAPSLAAYISSLASQLGG